MLKSRERNAEYLNYSVQNELVTTSVGEEQWNLLEQDARKYLFNVSQSLDKAFMYSSFPLDIRRKVGRGVLRRTSWLDSWNGRPMV